MCICRIRAFRLYKILQWHSNPNKLRSIGHCDIYRNLISNPSTCSWVFYSRLHNSLVVITFTLHTVDMLIFYETVFSYQNAELLLKSSNRMEYIALALFRTSFWTFCCLNHKLFDLPIGLTRSPLRSLHIQF